MKKRVLFSVLMFCIFVGSVMAQTRKVAILETVDRQNQVSYGVKLMLRGYLAEEVTNTAGYEAYDRIDVNKILDEQDFQRTGLVSDEDIKKIGRMTGVQYILVAEAGKMDEKNLFITAKILNVETAQIEKTENVITKTDINSLQQGAKDLASRLLKGVTSSTPEIKEKISNIPQPIHEIKYIEKLGKNEFKCGDKWMTQKEVNEFINNKDLCEPAYKQFQEGLKKKKSGKWTTIAGCTALLAGTLTLAIGLSTNEQYNCTTYVANKAYSACKVAGSVLMAVGGVTTITGGILWGVGIKKMNNAYEKFNEYCDPKHIQSTISLNLQTSSNGIGLALYF